MFENGYVLTVSQLNDYVSKLVSNDVLLKDVSVKGELSGFKRHSSGHIYFSLKDEGALVRCVMFKTYAQGLSTELSDGMKVTARGYASLYQKDGQFQLYVRAISKQGEGELYARFLQLKAKLEAEGLFAPELKKQIQLLPKCVGIVTSRTGAAIQDIANIIRRRFPTMNMTLYPTAVQGAGAAEEIARGIDVLSARSDIDVIIVGRGGGSVEDLWAFNEECVARAIYRSSTPIISAVGHETDFTIADFVADLRAPTPSAAAELCVPEYQAERASVADMKERLERAVRDNIRTKRAEIKAVRQSGALARVGHTAELYRRDINEKRLRLTEAVQSATATAYSELDKLCAALKALSPKNVLERGFAMIKSEAGGLAVSAATLKTGERAQIIMRDGSAEAIIDNVILREESL